MSKTFDYEDAALEFCARVEVGQADGTWITKAKAELTLEDIWEPWLATKSKASAKTRRDYESLWRCMCNRCGVVCGVVRLVGRR